MTGGGGFVGGNFVRLVLASRPRWRVTVFDSLGGAWNRPVLDGLEEHFPGRYRLVRGGITDRDALRRVFEEEACDTAVHFAARNPSGPSEADPMAFVEINVVGTATLLETAREAWGERGGVFLHLSSYEVYGSDARGIFTEASGLNPSTPYAASKAAADELTLAYHRTFGMHAMVTRTTNIYGPHQSRDKLIPAIALRVRDRLPLPVYGTGGNLRDWIHVDDHNRGVTRVLEEGRAGEVYHLGARCERSNLELIRSVARYAAEVMGREPEEAEASIEFVDDRQGHDARRSLDPSKAEAELGFKAEVDFEVGLRKTIEWVLSGRG